MLDPNIAPIVMRIVNLFAEYGLPINAKDKIFKCVEDVMNSQTVEHVDVLRYNIDKK